MENISQMSMLEVACTLMEQKRTAQSIKKIIKEVLEIKGIDDFDCSLASQLYIDITTSSKFVYMGNEEWDLKVRQSLDEFDKDGSAFNTKEDLIEEDEVAMVIPVDNFDDEDEEYEVEDEVVGLSKELEDDDDDEENDIEDEDTIDEDADFDDLDSDFMDEDKYNDYMDNYEDMYDDE